jgi:hypothetical protein
MMMMWMVVDFIQGGITVMAEITSAYNSAALTRF